MDTLLIIDDEPSLRKLFSRILELEGYEVFQADDCTSGMRQLKDHNPMVVLCDVFLPDGNGIDMVTRIKKQAPECEVILLTAYGNIKDGVQAIKNGAFDYMTKGDDNNKIIPIISRAVEKARLARGEKAAEKSSGYSFDTVTGSSPAIQEAVKLARRVAVTDVPVLLTGETGTGKEVFAQSIHKESRRSSHEFVAINCSAFSKDLLESELFGHMAGAFTGAAKEKKGLLEIADKGTLFLDEIGEMDPLLQAKILRVLESGEFIKIGDTKVTKADIRFIAATNRNLEKEIQAGRFRQDLYYRLSVFSIHLPPLRERTADMKELCTSLISRLAGKCGSKASSITPEAEALLERQEWHGNIRELRNVIERSLIVCDGDEIGVQDLPVELQKVSEHGSADTSSSDFELSAMEKRHIAKVLQYTGGNKTEAARLMKIGLTTLYRKIEEYRI